MCKDLEQCGLYTFRPSGVCYWLYQSGLYTFRLSEALENHISAPAVRKVYRKRVFGEYFVVCDIVLSIFLYLFGYGIAANYDTKFAIFSLYQKCRDFRRVVWLLNRLSSLSLYELVACFLKILFFLFRLFWYGLNLGDFLPIAVVFALQQSGL